MVECEYCRKNDGIVNRKIIRINIHERCIDDFENELEEIFEPKCSKYICKILDSILYLILFIAGCGIIMYISWGITGMFF